MSPLFAFHGRTLWATFAFAALSFGAITFRAALRRALAINLAVTIRRALTAITHLRTWGSTLSLAGSALALRAEAFTRRITLGTHTVTILHGWTLAITWFDLRALTIARAALWCEAITGATRRLTDAIAFTRSTTGRAITIATHLGAALALRGYAVTFTMLGWRALTTHFRTGTAAIARTTGGNLFTITWAVTQIAFAIGAGDAFAGLFTAYARAVTFARRLFLISWLRGGGQAAQEGGSQAAK
ncbi:MAG TPA: hypothetical protein VGH19_20410 [Verrucomicrobiae bacterium]